MGLHPLPIPSFRHFASPKAPPHLQHLARAEGRAPEAPGRQGHRGVPRPTLATALGKLLGMVTFRRKSQVFLTENHDELIGKIVAKSYRNGVLMFRDSLGYF